MPLVVISEKEEKTKDMVAFWENGSKSGKKQLWIWRWKMQLYRCQRGFGAKSDWFSLKSIDLTDENTNLLDERFW